MVAECKRLAVPASVDSIPTSGTTEDHVSMGWDAGLKVRRAVANAEAVVAIEALLAAQALDLRAPLEPSAAASAVRAAIRERVAFMPRDRFLAPDIEAARELAHSGALVAAASRAVGELR
jgi:histidine ammonia-lyase